MAHNEKDVYKAKMLANELGMSIFYKLDWSGNYKPEEPNKVSAVTGLNCFNRKDFENSTGHRYYNICYQMIFTPQINWDGRLLGCCGVYRHDWGINCFKDYNFEKALNNNTYRTAISHLLLGEQIDYECPCTNCSTYKKWFCK